MRMVLTSASLTTPAIVEACVELCKKPRESIRIAVINEAYAVAPQDKHWVINNLREIADNFPGHIDLVNLLALEKRQVKDRIANADMIVVLGGHTDYLMSVFQKTGFGSLLPKLLADKVYVGSSAGSMVVGRRISSELNSEIYGETNDYGVEQYLNLVNFGLVPHLGSTDFSKCTPTVLEALCQGLSFKIFGLKDDSAIMIDGGTTTTIGSASYLVGSAH